MPLWMRQAHFFDIDREWDTFVQHLMSHKVSVDSVAQGHST
jgi:hypothetical protein